MVKVHYFFDPMCGWCYGATRLIDALSSLCSQRTTDTSFSDKNSDELNLVLHPGGMIPRREIPDAFRHHIKVSDRKIGQTTGMVFSEDYLAMIGEQASLIFDSDITAQAVIAAETCELDPIAALKAIQHAHYVEAKNVSELNTLVEILVSLGGNAEQCEQAIVNAKQSASDSIGYSQELMRRYGLGGFPTLLVETSEGLSRLSHEAYYGKPIEDWKAYLADTFQQQ